MDKEKKYYAFPALFFYDNDGISVEFPDLPGCLPCAHTSEEAFQNAKEALGLHLFGMEQDGDSIPEPTPVRNLKADEGAVVTMIEVFMPAVRDSINERFVKKTLTLPAWLNRAAEERGVNFSQLLQESLKNYLGRSSQNDTTQHRLQ